MVNNYYTQTYIVYAVCTAIILVITWIPPFATVNTLNNEFNDDMCNPFKGECCNGIDYPNFVLTNFYDSDKDSGLYVKIAHPSTIYGMRIIGIQLPISVIWLLITGLMFAKNEDKYILHVFLLLLFIFGLISSMAYMIGGPLLKYEFTGRSNSPVYLKTNLGYTVLDNIYLAVTTNDRNCDTIDLNCKNHKYGLVLSANANFSGFDGKNVGPWSYDIIPVDNQYYISKQMVFRDECASVAQRVIAVDGGNVSLPIIYFLGMFIVFLTIRYRKLLPVLPSIQLTDV